MSSSRNTYNVANESEQWQKLYRTIEDNVRREILIDIDAKMDKLKRKNRKLKDQNKCLMEMVAMMRVSSANTTAAVSRFIPHTPSGLCTPVTGLDPETPSTPKAPPVCLPKPSVDIPKLKLENIIIKTEKKSVSAAEVVDLTETKVVSVPLSTEYENVVCCANCRCKDCVCVINSDVEEELEEPEVEEQEVVEETAQADEEEEEVEEEEQEEVVEETIQEEEEEPDVQTTVKEDEEEESVEEVLINGKRYYTSNTKNGEIYDIDEEDNPGDVVGKYVNGVPEFITKDVQPEEEEEQEEEEESVEEMDINNVKYYVTNTRNGTIYEMLEDGDVGDEIGKFVNGKPVFNK